MKVVRMRGDFGEVLLVVPAHDGLGAAQKLVGIVSVIAIAIDADLKHVVSDQFGTHFEGKLCAENA